MTKPRTLEEITYDAWVAVHTPGNLSREVIFAALREAADAAYESGLKLGTAQQAEAADAARREDREALTAEIDRLSDQPLTDEQRMDAPCRWNLARSRAEEPK